MRFQDSTAFDRFSLFLGFHTAPRPFSAPAAAPAREPKKQDEARACWALQLYNDCPFTLDAHTSSTRPIAQMI